MAPILWCWLFSILYVETSLCAKLNQKRMRNGRGTRRLFNMAATAILQYGVEPSVLRFLNSALVCVPNYIKIGSLLAEKQPSKLFKHDGSGHLGKWRQTLGDAFFVYIMSILFCESNLIKIGSEMAELQPSKLFQHNGGGPSGKLRRTPALSFLGLSMSISVCVYNFIKIGR